MQSKEEATQEMNRRLDAIIRLLAAPLVKGKAVGESVRTLSDLGLDRKLIGEICHTNPNAVRAHISDGKRISKVAPAEGKPARKSGRVRT